MNIQVRYQTNPEALANASLLYLERRPLMRISVLLFNIIGSFYILLIGLKAYLGLNVQLMELSLLVFCMTWVFGRKYLTRQMLKWRLQKMGTEFKPVEIDISSNGIIWSGEGLKKGHLSWKEVTHVIKTLNGYIVGTKISQFLWCPFQGFVAPEMKNAFEKTCCEKEVKVIELKRSC